MFLRLKKGKGAATIQDFKGTADILPRDISYSVENNPKSCMIHYTGGF